MIIQHKTEGYYDARCGKAYEACVEQSEKDERDFRNMLGKLEEFTEKE